MVLPFGVSVGDFVSTLGLIRKIAAALAESHGSGAQFRKLEATLGCLERAVKRVEEADHAGDVVDDEFAANWKETTEHMDVLVKDFHKKITKYQPSLRLGGSSSKWRDAMRKIQFTTIKDDIAEFETQLLVQMGTLQLLLEEEKSFALARIEHRIQRIETKVDETQLTQVSLKTAATQIFGLLSGILGLLLASGGSFMSIPRQICFSGHLTFQDAWGDYFPLHIEMVGCWEMLYGVLQIKLRDKPGSQAVKAKNFKLQDGSVAGKWSDIDVDKPYEQVFQSGGRWDMAMIFPRDRQTEGGCPKCGRAEDPGADPSKIECRNPACRLCYSRVTDIFSEVHILPEHYEMPSMMDTPDRGPDPADMVAKDEAGADLLAVDATHSSQSPGPQQLDVTSDADDDGEAPEPAVITTTWQGEVRLEDLANVYLARPPVVFLRSPKQIWYMVPWRLFRTLQGLRFFAEYVCKLPFANVHLRDWHTGHVIDGSNWGSVDEGVYYGMAVELICLESAERQGSVGWSGSRRCPTGLCCHLCGKTFFSQVTLGRHTATHLRDKACPGACTTCGVI